MEVWKPIRGYEGRYLISNLGNIISCYTGEKMSFGKDKSGYYIVNLSNTRGRKTQLVHRLVARTFIEKKNGFNEVNHINENKNDNRVENLEWVSHSENLKKYWSNHPEMYEKCGITKRVGERQYYIKKGTKHSKKRIVQLSLDNKKVNAWKNLATIHKILGYHPTSIYECCTGKRHTAYGYRWQFAIEIQDKPSVSKLGSSRETA